MLHTRCPACPPALRQTLLTNLSHLSASPSCFAGQARPFYRHPKNALMGIVFYVVVPGWASWSYTFCRHLVVMRHSASLQAALSGPLGIVVDNKGLVLVLGLSLHLNPVAYLAVAHHAVLVYIDIVPNNTPAHAKA